MSDTHCSPGGARGEIALFGASLDTGNMGVSALALCTVGLVQSARSDSRIKLFIGSADSRPQIMAVRGQKVTIPVVNYRLSPRAALQEHAFWILFNVFLWRVCPWRALHRHIARVTPWIRELSRCEVAADISGGDSFSDIYGLSRFLVTALPIVTAILLRRKVVLLPQTYGPFSSRVSRLLAGWVLRRADWVLSRDLEPGGSVRTKRLRALVEQRAVFCPDVAFDLEAETSAAKAFGASTLSAGRISGPLVGLNVNGLLYQGGYTGRNMFGLRHDYRDMIRTLISAVLRETQANLVLIPHNFGARGSVNNDQDACEWAGSIVSDQDIGRVRILRGERGPSELKGYIGLCDLFVGSRMHACIAALSQGIPAIALAYSGKFLGMFRSIGMEQLVVDLRTAGPGDAINAVFSTFENRERIAKELRERVKLARIQQRDVFRMVFGSDRKCDT